MAFLMIFVVEVLNHIVMFWLQLQDHKVRYVGAPSALRDVFM